MEPAQAEALTKLRLASTLDWAEVDACYAIIVKGEEPGQGRERSDTWQTAQALCAKATIGQMNGIAAPPVPGQNQLRATISPARIVARQVVMERTVWDLIPHVPEWISAKDWVEVRFSNVQPRELLLKEKELLALLEKARSPEAAWPIPPPAHPPPPDAGNQEA